MHRFGYTLLFFAFVVLGAGAGSNVWSRSTPEDVRTPQTSLSAEHIPSRSRQQTEDYFYYPPTGLADDYPEGSTTDKRIQRDVEIIKDIGVEYFRFGIGWDSIHQEPGYYDWDYWDNLVNQLHSSGAKLIPYVAYTAEWVSQGGYEDFWKAAPRNPKAFGDFMYKLVTRYKDKIHAWELWTEPDNNDYWTGTEDEFGEMIVYAAQQVKKADPDAVVVLGGLTLGASPFFKSLVEKYEIHKHFDAVNLHGYYETWSPAQAEDYPALMWSVAEYLKSEKADMDLWLAEFGYSDYRMTTNRASKLVPIHYKYEHTTEYQAEALWKHHVLALGSESLSLMTWFRITDLPHDENVIGDANNRHLGIIEVNGEPKPAYAALKFYQQVFNKPLRLINEGIQIRRSKEDSHAEVYFFQEKDGEFIFNGWLRSLEPDEYKQSDGRAEDQRRETVSLGVGELSGSKWTRVSATGDVLEEGRVAEDGWLREIPLRGDRVTIIRVQPESRAQD